MKKQIRFCIFTIYLTLFSFLAHADNYEQCTKVSEFMRQMLPLRKDNYTILKSVSCLSNKPKAIVVHNLEIFGINPDIARRIDVNEIKPDVLNSYCTNPRVRPSLDAFDVEFRYYHESGQFIGSYFLQLKDCKK